MRNHKMTPEEQEYADLEQEMINEDLKVLVTFTGIFLGFFFSFIGIFFHGDILAAALPIWILSTVYVTKDLTNFDVHDIKKALELSR